MNDTTNRRIEGWRHVRFGMRSGVWLLVLFTACGSGSPTSGGELDISGLWIQEWEGLDIVDPCALDDSCPVDTLSVFVVKSGTNLTIEHLDGSLNFVGSIDPATGEFAVSDAYVITAGDQEFEVLVVETGVFHSSNRHTARATVTIDSDEGDEILIQGHRP